MTVAARRIPNGVAQTAHLSPERPVAGYLRSATQLEGESLRDQLEMVLRYARDHGMQLIRIYCDECGSGLRIDDRPGLRQLFRDIEGGASDFGDVLLLNRSRWSRSLYPDHSQLIEDRCKKAGIAVHYCAEGLMDDQIAISTLVKSIKRAMVREYPRKLTNPRQPRRGLLKRGIAAGNYGGGLDRPAVQDTGPQNAAGANRARPAPE